MYMYLILFGTLEALFCIQISESLPKVPHIIMCVHMCQNWAGFYGCVWHNLQSYHLHLTRPVAFSFDLLQVLYRSYLM